MPPGVPAGREAREGGRGRLHAFVHGRRGTPCREGTIILLTLAALSVLRFPLLVSALPRHMADSKFFVVQTGAD